MAAALQDHHAATLLATGLTLLPFAVGFGAGSTLGSLVSLHRYRVLVAAGLTVLGADLSMLAALTRDSGRPAAPAGVLSPTPVSVTGPPRSGGRPSASLDTAAPATTDSG
ncbi:hypothetical protein [Streptomyces sp. NPDC048665]|uniref:hypothetical protein n=1 Tax=Streptomyces sp. NPDC048665 TaxID=3155490 RepID=UPI00342BD898